MKNICFTIVAFLFLAVAQAQIVYIPDANFKAKLLSFGSCSDEFGNTISIDSNNDGEIEQIEASFVYGVFVANSGINNLQGLYFFNNLKFFDCSNNQLTFLIANICPNLKDLRCSNNQLTTIEVSGLTNLEILYCSNNQLGYINLNGLINLTNLGCSSNQLQTLNVSGMPNLTILGCDNNNLQSLNVSGSANLIELSCVNNNLSSLNLSGLTNLFYFYCAFNQLQTLNFSGVPKLKTLACENNNLQSLNVNGLLDLFSVTCQNNQLTSLYIKNGYFTDWYALTITGNPNLRYICADDADIINVQNEVNLAGYASVCQVNSYCSFTPEGTFYTIQGNSKFDINSNGCDSNDLVCPNLKFNITNGTVSGSIISNVTGNYYIPVQAGSHTITPQIENPSYFSVSPTSATVTFPATTSPFIQNFCIVPNGIHHDLEVIVIPMGVARPGFDAKYKIKYKNKGNQTENATVNFSYNDAILDYVSSSLAPTIQTTGILSWNIGTINPFQTGEIIITLNVNSPMETPAVNGGDILSYSATANGLTNDETPDDNTFALSQTVFNSFDPNDKTCLEGNVINPTMIGKYVHYKIRFENTGTFAAQNIVVKDMIDSTKFDITSLQMTDASHGCVTRITNTNKVEFIFENINLPFDDANNDGYVVFKIKTKPTLTVGSTISNSANIYFDYNFPIVTNTATSTFTTLQKDSFEFDNYFTMYPNPVAEILNLKTKQETKIYSLTIYNTIGQQVQTITNPSNAIDVASLKTGNYLVKVVTDKGISSSKFVKE